VISIKDKTPTGTKI